MEILTGFLDEPALAALRAWLTLIFAGIAAYLGVQRYRQERGSAAKAASRLWSIRLGRGALEPKDHLLELRLDDAGANRYRVRTMRAVKPRGARIAKADFRNSHAPGMVAAGYVPDIFSRSLTIERDVEPDHHPGFTAKPRAHGTILFFAAGPVSRRPWSRSAASRLILAVEIEEISASRSSSRLIVQSQPIEWTVSRKKSAT